MKAFFEKINEKLNHFRQKIAPFTKVCKYIFGYGIMIVLFAGGLTFFGYIVALIIGGETATEICNVIYKKIVPVIIYASTVLILFGLFTMYLAGEKALTPGQKKKKQLDEGEK